MTAGDLEGASSAAQEALAIDPNEAQVYFLLASLAEVLSLIHISEPTRPY